jgi:thiol peroxidase
MSEGRVGAVTSKGKPLTVMGVPLEVGDTAPDFTLTANDLTKVSLSDSSGKVRLISVVPNLTTGICDAQTRRFNEEAANFGDDVVILTVSSEHPFNQRSWCGAAGVENLQVLSDHESMSFGDAYGTHVKELRLEQRSVFVVDRNDIITYVEYVPIIGQHVDYEAALEALRETLQQ